MTTAVAPPKRKGLFQQAFWLIRSRPAYFYRAARGYLLFHFARTMRAIRTPPGLTLGPNVRLQKNSSVMAEAPSAHISIGAHSIVYEDAKIEAYGQGQVQIGSSAILGNCRIACRHGVTIGDRFLSSWNVFLQDYDSHPVSVSKRRSQVQEMAARFRPSFDGVMAPVDEPLTGWDFPGERIRIGDDVWVGADCIVLKGAEIGDGCIVAAGSVVLKGSYPPHSLIGGNPATVIKQLKE